MPSRGASTAVTPTRPQAAVQTHELVAAVLDPQPTTPAEDGRYPSKYFDHLRGLFDTENRFEQSMFHAINHLLDLIGEDANTHTAWTEAMKRAHNFDSHKINYGGGYHSSGDDLLLSNLIGDHCNLEMWMTSSERSLKE